MGTCRHRIYTCGNGKEIEFCIDEEDGSITIYPDASASESDQYNLSHEDSQEVAGLILRAQVEQLRVAQLQRCGHASFHEGYDKAMSDLLRLLPVKTS